MKEQLEQERETNEDLEKELLEVDFKTKDLEKLVCNKNTLINGLDEMVKKKVDELNLLKLSQHMTNKTTIERKLFRRK